MKVRLAASVLLAALGLPSGCVPPSTAKGSENASNAAAVVSLDKWWQDFAYAPEPVKAGTVTSAHSITTKSGVVRKIPKHVQSRQEAAEEADDFLYNAHKRALVTGFTIKGRTVVVATTIGAENRQEAREICQNIGAFVYANPNRHYGLEKH